MSQNALLDAPNASGYHASGSYHRPMAAPPHQPPPPPQWAPTPPPNQSRRWLPAAIISAAILITGAIIGGAIIINSGNSNDTAATPPGPSAVAPGNPGTQVSAADSSTCQGWAAATAALNVIPALPAGWDWDTPRIDALIADQNAAIKTAMDLFEGDISESDPPQVAAAARDYVAAQRHSMQQFADRAFTTADGVPVTTARVKLDHACGVS
ncbi:MAG: hypothetical protein ACPGXI_17540 [Mycobacterium sp.]